MGYEGGDCKSRMSNCRRRDRGIEAATRHQPNAVSGGAFGHRDESPTAPGWQSSTNQKTKIWLLNSITYRTSVALCKLYQREYRHKNQVSSGTEAGSKFGHLPMNYIRTCKAKFLRVPDILNDEGIGNSVRSVRRKNESPGICLTLKQSLKGAFSKTNNHLGSQAI